MGHVERFEDLRIWQEARIIVKGSCGEIRSMYYVAENLQYVSEDIAEVKRKDSCEIGSTVDIPICDEMIFELDRQECLSYFPAQISFSLHFARLLKRRKREILSGGIAGLMNHLKS